MVDVLIISYNALPMDVVSSYRAKAYCDHFSSFGIRPTLLTHRWERGNGKFQVHQSDDRVVVDNSDRCSIIRLPYPGIGKSPGRMHTVLSYLNGNLDAGLAASYEIFKRFLWEHLKTNQYHLIIAIYNPHFHLKLAYECYREFKVPYVLDFRDLWDNQIVTATYQPGLRKRIIDLLISRWWRKWIRGSLFFSTTGDKWRRYLSALSGKEGVIVRNGFDSVPHATPELLRTRSKKFKVMHFGRMYEGQDLGIFIEGFKKFAIGFSPEEVAFEILGLKMVAGMSFEGKIKEALGPYVVVKPYMPKDELMKYCANEADLFFFPGFRDDNGQFPVKVYDYMTIGRNIIVAPGGGEVSKVVKEVNAGRVFNTPDQVADYLAKSYAEFRATGTVSFRVKRGELEKYTRKTQVRIMAEKIHQVLSKG